MLWIHSREESANSAGSGTSIDAIGIPTEPNVQEASDFMDGMLGALWDVMIQKKYLEEEIRMQVIYLKCL